MYIQYMHYFLLTSLSSHFLLLCNSPCDRPTISGKKHVLWSVSLYERGPALSCP